MSSHRKNEKQDAKVVSLNDIENFCREVADCPLEKPKIESLQVGDIVMCHEHQNWTDPNELGSVHWAAKEAVDLPAGHSDMAKGNMFVKPGRAGARDKKYNTLTAMKSNCVLHCKCVCCLFAIPPSYHSFWYAESVGWWNPEETRLLPKKGQRFGDWLVESVSTNVHNKNLYDSDDLEKNWSCVVVKSVEQNKTVPAAQTKNTTKDPKM